MSSRDDEYTAYVSARMTSLRRTAYMLCQDWHRADDLVQATITQLYVHWARAADHTDAYARTVLVREFLGERRSASGVVTTAVRLLLPVSRRARIRAPLPGRATPLRPGARRRRRRAGRARHGGR